MFECCSCLCVFFKQTLQYLNREYNTILSSSGPIRLQMLRRLTIRLCNYCGFFKWNMLQLFGYFIGNPITRTWKEYITKHPKLYSVQMHCTRNSLCQQNSVFNIFQFYLQRLLSQEFIRNLLIIKTCNLLNGT